MNLLLQSISWVAGEVDREHLRITAIEELIKKLDALKAAVDECSEGNKTITQKLRKLSAKLSGEDV